MTQKITDQPMRSGNRYIVKKFHDIQPKHQILYG